LEGYGIFFVVYICSSKKHDFMKSTRSRLLIINLLISFVIALFMVLPMLLGVMGYDIFNRRPAPAPQHLISFWQIAREGLLYLIMVFILLTVNTINSAKLSQAYKILTSLAITVIFYFLFTVIRPIPIMPERPEGRPFPNAPAMQQGRPLLPGMPAMIPPNDNFRQGGLDYRRVTEFLFIFVITALLGKVLELINVQQKMQLENEQLRSENLQNRYDVLLNQINPHFFFNSLNSLASLVRDGRSDNALKYIDELSNTYRYAMQSPGKELVTVGEELESLKAYSYLQQIRFEDKLFIEIDVDEAANRMLLPVLSLQPLIENVVKHNIISTDAPLTITITGNTESITVLNPVRPRHTQREKSGTGLKNLCARYKLLTGRDLLIENGNTIFSVTLPLVKPSEL
jgi:two-component system LytT family sensor kinase